MKGFLKIYFGGAASVGAGLVAGYFIWPKENDDRTFTEHAPVITGIALAWPIVIPPFIAMEVDSFITGSTWHFKGHLTAQRRTKSNETTSINDIEYGRPTVARVEGDVKAIGAKQ